MEQKMVARAIQKSLPNTRSMLKMIVDKKNSACGAREQFYSCPQQPQTERTIAVL